MSANRERLLDLLADRATVGLTNEEQAELAQLSAADDIDLDSMDRAAAALDLAFTRGSVHPELPAALRAKVLSQWSAQPSTARIVPLRRGPSYAWLGWAAAAAAILIALVGWWPRLAVNKQDLVNLTPAERHAVLERERQALIEHAGDEVLVSWKPTEDPSGKNVGGDIVWSDKEQHGFMRFHGLPKNDPSAKQYQLWIFDKAQDDRYPIDGGVFDIDADSGDVIVPITAKIHVLQAKMFAITVEKPGGVVVSSREHLVALGQI